MIADRLTLVAGAAIALSACEASDQATYTLYRGSVVGNLRIHLATFDAEEGNDYNQTNCQLAADLFQRQPGVTVRYWCEKGEFRP